MVYKTIDTSLRADSENALRTFKAVVTDVEIVLNGEHLVELLKKSPTDSNSLELTRFARAFTLAKRRRESLKTHLDQKLKQDTAPIDAIVMREFDSIPANSRPSIRSIADLRRHADKTEQAFGDALIASGHSSDDLTLPPDGSGDSLPPLPPPDSGGGGSPAPETVEPPSFEQYPVEIQQQAQSAYDQQVSPNAEAVVAGGSAEVQSLFDAIGINPFPELVNELRQSVNNIRDTINAGITGIVVGVAFSIPIIGPAVAALAVIAIPIMLDAFESFVVDKFSALFA